MQEVAAGEIWLKGENILCSAINSHNRVENLGGKDMPIPELCSWMKQIRV